ncbi:MAG: hypothetical protein ABR971_08870, partial [Acidobacteriaceae bacterium]
AFVLPLPLFCLCLCLCLCRCFAFAIAFLGQFLKEIVIPSTARNLLSPVLALAFLSVIPPGNLLLLLLLPLLFELSF